LLLMLLMLMLKLRLVLLGGRDSQLHGELIYLFLN
jgi:hypothetical protein